MTSIPRLMTYTQIRSIVSKVVLRRSSTVMGSINSHHILQDITTAQGHTYSQMDVLIRYALSSAHVCTQQSAAIVRLSPQKAVVVINT